MPFLSLQDDQYPHLVFINDHQPYAWDAGFLYSLWMRSALVRVSSRGVQAVYGTPRVDALEAGHWHRAHCLPTKGALCNFNATERGVSTNMLLFPTGVVDVPDDFYELTTHGHAFLKYFNNNSPCTYTSSNREIVEHDTRYEVSLCDLLNANLDFVVTRDRVFWRQDVTTTAEYVLFSVLGIMLVSQLTSNIMHIMNRGAPAKEVCAKRGGEDAAVKKQDPPVSKQHPALYAVFLFATSLFLTVRTWTHVVKYVVTREDYAAALTLTVFTWTQYTQHYASVAWTGLRALQAWLKRDDRGWGTYTQVPNGFDGDYAERDGMQKISAGDGGELDSTDRSFSMLIALLLLLILQVYFTTDTPYGTVMVTLFLARSCHKILQRASLRGAVGGSPKVLDTENPFFISHFVQSESVLYERARILFALWCTLLDLFTAVVLVQGLAIVQTDMVQKQVHVLAVVVVAVVIAMSMVRLEAALKAGD
jgi:hypothetical protein